MDRKALKDVELDTKGEGSFRAVIATFNVVDHDGDVTLPGAFKDGAPVRIARWGHNWSDLPVGKGKLGSDADKAWVDGQFNLKTTHGRDTYETVKDLGDLQEWSHGYDPRESSTEPDDLAPFAGASRILKALDLVEVSPVMLGAGIGTYTENIKGGAATLAARVDRLLADTPALIEHARAAVTMREKSGRVLSAVNRTRLTNLAAAWETGLSDLQALLAATTDAGDEEKARAALAAMDIESLFDPRRIGAQV